MNCVECENCGRIVDKTDLRTAHVMASRDEPGYDAPACVHCAPTSDDVERARNAFWDVKLAESREA